MIRQNLEACHYYSRKGKKGSCEGKKIKGFTSLDLTEK